VTFPDHFSKLAGGYSRFRPGYPDALFEYLASQCARHELAWDAGTGNGQAAVGLARHFRRVIATDASAEQLAHAERNPRIEYRLAQESPPDLSAQSVDLVSAAQAAHWFDLETFYAEARRVLRPDGVIAVWTYVLPRTTPEIDQILDRYYRDIVGPYWPPERRHVDSGYDDLPFPFAELEAPPLAMNEQWDCARFLGYLGTWSATARFREAHGRDPLELIAAELRIAWRDPERLRSVTWPLAMRIGRVAP
jgi:SAM-dependent methyltransferase